MIRHPHKKEQTRAVKAMNSLQRMSAFSILVQHEVKTWTATSFAILILVGFTNSIPVAPPEPAEPSSVSDASPESLHPGKKPFHVSYIL